MGLMMRGVWDNSFASAGNHTITADLRGQTPVAVLCYLFGTDQEETPEAHAMLSMGAATAVGEQWCTSVRSRDNNTPSSTGRIGMTDECICKLFLGSNAVDGECTFNEFVVNGVTITTGNAFSSSYYALFVFLVGDVEAHAAAYTLAAAEDDDIDITAPGFEFDFMLTGGHANPFNDSGSTTMFVSMGLVLNLATGLEQYSICYAGYNGQNPSAIYAELSSSYGWGAVISSGLALAAEYSDVDSEGFTSTTRLAGASSSEGVGYLAVKLNGTGFDGGLIDSPIATGHHTEDDPDFKPQFVLQLLTQMPAIDTLYSDDNAGALGVSAIDKGGQYCGSVADADNVNPTNAQSLIDDKAILFALDDGTTGHEADFLEFVNNGWKSNFTTTQGTAKKWLYLAVAESGVGRLVNPRTHLQALTGGKLA